MFSTVTGALCSDVDDSIDDSHKMDAEYVKVDQDTLGDLLKQYGSELLNIKLIIMDKV